MKTTSTLMKINFLFINLLLLPILLNAQQAVITSGTDVNGNGGMLSYSIGQISYNLITSDATIVSEGVQQTIEVYVLGIESPNPLVNSIKLFPNPSSDFITISTKDLNIFNLRYELYDINGKILWVNSISSSETKIDISTLDSGIYLLNIMDINHTLKMFRLIKNSKK